MIKIAHIAKPVGGVGVYVQLLTKHINSNKFNNILLCDTKEGILKLEDDNKNSISKFHINIIREIKILSDIKCLISIIKILKKEKPNIIHCHSAKAGILGRIAGAYLKIPTVYTPHAYSYLSAETKTKKRVFKSIEKLFKIVPSKTLACSFSEYNRTINDLGFKKNNVLLWNNSIENNFNLSKVDFKLPNNFICSIGRPSYQKNTQLLIQSLYELKKQINTIHLVILGVGHYSPDLEKVEDLINKLNLKDNITLIPWLKRNQTLAILKESDIFISTSRYEGLPYALIEAIALNKACIVTDVDGNKDLVKNNINGYTVKENAFEIANKTAIILKNESLRKQMEKNSKELFHKNFNIENNISKLEKIYLQLA